MPVETKNRAVNVRLARKNAHVIRQIARRKIIRPVNHDLVICDYIGGICRGESALVRCNVDVWIDVA